MNAMWEESGDQAGSRSESSIPDGPSSSVTSPVVTSIRTRELLSPPFVPPVAAIQRPFGDQASPPMAGNATVRMVVSVAVSTMRR